MSSFVDAFSIKVGTIIEFRLSLNSRKHIGIVKEVLYICDYASHRVFSVISSDGTLQQVHSALISSIMLL